MRASTWLAALAALAVLTAPIVSAEATNSQQEKMKTCNEGASAKGLKGEERQAFMKNCLSAHPEAAAKTNSQQEKMKSCNKAASAKGLKGDEHKAFMSTCLSGSAK